MKRSRTRPQQYRPPRSRVEVAVAALGALAVVLFTAGMIWVLGPHESDAPPAPNPDPIVHEATTTTVAPTTTPADSAPASG